jgi:hypothetical protein
MKKGTTVLLVSIISIFLLVSASAIKNETNRVLINEFVTNPQTDWDGSGSIGFSDEWFELHNPESSSIIIDNWHLKLIDSSIETENLSGTIPAGGYLTILNPVGHQNDDGRIELYDNLNNLVDSVSYGNYNDGNISDNAPDGTAASIFDECIARYPDGIDTEVDSNDFIKTLCTYNSQNNFSFKPVNITTFPAQPLCSLDTDNLTVRAEITGSIAGVKLLLNTNGVIREIVLPGDSEGIYSYIITSSETNAGTTVEWQFVVTDVRGNETYGETGSARIYYITSLQVFPPTSNGLNGWYISEPQFELSNPDATQIDYRWNGIHHVYSLPFGLEGTPNSGNVTGGIHVLYYWSDVCDESEKSFVGKFDFKDPEIKSLTPSPGSKTFNEQITTVSAHIDEVFQGNSGVNFSSVKMEIDNHEVPITVNSSGPLDADIKFEGALSTGEHEIVVNVEDKSGRSSSAGWTFELLPPVPLNMTINMPTEGIYNDRRIQFNLSLTRDVQEIYFINYNDPNPTFKRLCRDCNGFGDDKPMFKSLKEGTNSLTFRAELNGEVLERSVSLTIDSEEPQILNVLPKSGLASGIFEIEFKEDNPLSLIIFFGNQELGFKNASVNISSKCQKNGKYSCFSEVNLSSYDGTQIEYYVSLTDVAGNIENSRTRTLDVDISHPIIKSFDFEVDGKYATFLLDVEEPYLNEIVYIDHLDEKPKEIVLCTSLADGICQKKVSLIDGNHSISVIVRDLAGNEAEAFSNFFTDSKAPKIKSTEPTKGFSSGTFTLTFEEVSPAEGYLTYGNIKDYSNKIYLPNCTKEKKNAVCTLSVNVSEFDGQEISYWFNITDLANNFVESKHPTLKVDATPPQITEFNYLILGRNVEFRIGVEDANFEEIVYQDREETNPQFKTLCSRLVGGICEGTKKFSSGNHVLDIIAKDKAGNDAIVINGFILSV